MARTSGPCANKFLYEKIKTVNDIPYSVPHNLTKEHLAEFYMVCIKILEEAGENERAKICREKMKDLDNEQTSEPMIIETYESGQLSLLQKSIKEHKR